MMVRRADFGLRDDRAVLARNRAKRFRSAPVNSYDIPRQPQPPAFVQCGASTQVNGAMSNAEGQTLRSLRGRDSESNLEGSCLGAIYCRLTMKIGIVTLGCDKNTVDNEYLAGALSDDGVDVVRAEPEPNGAKFDAVLINTC